MRGTDAPRTSDAAAMKSSRRRSQTSASVLLAGFCGLLQGRRPARNIRSHGLAQVIGAAFGLRRDRAAELAELFRRCRIVQRFIERVGKLVDDFLWCALGRID